ncbi:MAG TPA: NfeD family protein [Gemmatimonadales bacterium]|nr:NfeD family protein [Gemmatimonadales bacterium]
MPPAVLLLLSICLPAAATSAAAGPAAAGSRLAGDLVSTVPPDWLEALVQLLTNPLIAPILLSLGILGIAFEIKAGAFGLGALVSLVSLGLFFGSSFLTGLAGWNEIILLGVGSMALAIEVFILPGFGVAGITGIVALAAAVFLALVGGAPTAAGVTQAFAVLGVSAAITLGVGYAWLRHLPNSGRFAGLFLRGGAHRADGYVAALPRADLIGQDGIALTDLRPAGTAQIGSERVDVVTEGEYVHQGGAVRVVRSEGYRHVVRGVR